MSTIYRWVDGKAHVGDRSHRSPVWNPATGEQPGWVALAGATTP
jgi:hypothetical protein